MARAIILGCGLSGADYASQPDDHIYAVNDAAKFGHNINTLVFINRPSQFPTHRLEVIKTTKAERVFCLHTNSDYWSGYFPHVQPLPLLERWRSGAKYYKEKVYHTADSPFTAMCLSIHEGHKDIVLFGVDFVDHKYLTAIGSVPAYSQVARRVEQLGVKLFKGSEYSRLQLPVWP
jgi:hypothetical protein